MEGSTYYTASSSSSTIPTRPVSRLTQTTPLSRAQLNREQTVACNVVFVVAVLLYIFVLVWCMDLSRTGFYLIFSINAVLLVTAYWMWDNAVKWFHIPDTVKRRNT